MPMPPRPMRRTMRNEPSVVPSSSVSRSGSRCGGRLEKIAGRFVRVDERDAPHAAAPGRLRRPAAATRFARRSGWSSALRRSTSGDFHRSGVHLARGRGAAFERALEPRARHRPLPFHGRGRTADDFRRFLDRQAAEVAQLDDAGQRRDRWPPGESALRRARGCRCSRFAANRRSRAWRAGAA